MRQMHTNLEILGATVTAAPAATEKDAVLLEKIIASLREVFDPELPVNIYDLGLIYAIRIDQRDVSVDMTLTSPNCPVAGSLPTQVESVIMAIDGVDQATVQLTWDPPWEMERLSDEVKLTLGLL